MQTKSFIHSSFDQALATVRGMSDLTTQFYSVPTPSELTEIYGGGFPGAKTPPSGYHPKSDKYPGLYDVFSWARGIGKGKLITPYTAILRYVPTWGGDEAQTTGSCVSHGGVNAAELDHANDALMGETDFKGRLVKEALYRARGYNGAGWWCNAAADYIGPDGDGGLLFRKEYSNGRESIDFSKFSRETENWASNGKAGVPDWLEEEAAKNKAKWIIGINDLDEYRDCLALGFGINVCSGYAYSSTTDSHGVAKQKGTWNHAMAHIGCDDREWAHREYGGMLGLILQSWGNWNRQNGVPDGAPPMPTGAFYARDKDVLKMLKSGRGAPAICGLWGFDRTTWEAFLMPSEHGTINPDGFFEKMKRDSTIQDYYKVRSERVLELSDRVAASELLAI